ncbi:hypothetical protein ZWY2020_052649 [Hordeum vulgare]|nr:hypothetical protein ZWY2020_052649 [Hordeum vulgare]
MQTPANKSVGTVATGDDRVVAIEFDTYLNDGFDASGSHMGIDMNSIISGAYTNATVPGRNLTSVVVIGFSGATGVAVELQQIVSWSFESTLDPPRESPGSRPPTPKTLLLVEIITGRPRVLLLPSVPGLIYSITDDVGTAG